MTSTLPTLVSISPPKILIAGPGLWPWYERACAAALRSLGCRVVEFSWCDDFYRWTEGRKEPVARSFSRRIQNRFLFGPALNAVNESLVRAARAEQPDIIWLYNASHIYAKTVRELRHLKPQPKLVAYTNDNPFGTNRAYWRHFREAIPLFDQHFVYRPSNIEDLRRLGVSDVTLLRSYYIADEDYRSMPSREETRFLADVVFAGHYEDDGRLSALEAIAATGVKLNVFGGGWAAQVAQSSPLWPHVPIAPVIGEDYRKAISGASIALCFLSKINRDTYTRRNFQIPAMRTFMLSEYTDDLASLFQEGVHAEFFRSREELLDKIRFYTQNAAARERIAAGGHRRVVEDGHDVRSRMSMFVRRVWPDFLSPVVYDNYAQSATGPGDTA